MSPVFADAARSARPGRVASVPRMSSRPRLAVPAWIWIIGPVVALGPFYWIMSPTAIPAEPRIVGGILWALSVLPGLWYFGRPTARRPPIPLFPILGLLYGLYYSLQLVLGADSVHPRVRLDPSTDYLAPANFALWGWLLLLAGTILTTWAMPGGRSGRVVRWRTADLAKWATVIQLGGLALEVARYELPIPVALRGLLNFAGMLALFGTGILVVLDARGQLTPTQRTHLWIAVAVLLVIQAGSGSVANLGRAGLTVVIARFIGGARMRAGLIVVGLILGLIVITLRGFAIEFREQAWGSGDLSQGARTALWYSLVRTHADQNGWLSVAAHGTEVVATRTAHVDLFADVIRQTPESVPYWGGYTYVSLVGSFVPRILWPDKPQKITGQDFGHRYGYLYENDRSTSINLPFLVEFYANFGENGVYIGMFIIGVILAVLQRTLNRPRQTWVRSLCGLVLLLPLVTNIESDFSLIFGGLILNGLAMYLVYRFLLSRCAAGEMAGRGARAAGGRST